MAKGHTVRLQINCGGDQVGWYFARFNGSESWEDILERWEDLIEGWEDIITLFSSPRSCDFPEKSYTKIKHRDDDSKRMYRGDRYDEIFQITDPGIYILDFSNWDADSRIGATLTIDDEVRFSTSSAGVPRDLNSSMIYWNNFWGPDPETRPTAVQSNQRQLLIKVD